MSTLRISDAPLLPDVDGTEKIPTGGRGDYAISVDQIKDHIFEDVGKELVGLGNVDNTSDLDKPVSTAQQAALNLKADKTYVDNSLDLKADKTSVYTRSETTLALSKKADLVNGVVPENQIPSSFNDVLEFTTANLPIVGESGKIYVTTDSNKTWRWSGNKYVEISGWNPDSVSKSVTLPTYYTKESGVDTVIGVVDGAYFNVRSEDNDTIAIEYQNVGGVATPTGKSYPSSGLVNSLKIHNNLDGRDDAGAHPASAIFDARGLNQQEINNLSLTPHHFGAIGDGMYHKLSERYATLADARLKYPTAQSLDDSIDLCALEAFFDHCHDNVVSANITLNAYVNRPLYVGMIHKDHRYSTKVYNGHLTLTNTQTDVEIPFLMRINAADTSWTGKLSFYGTIGAVKDRKQLGGLVIGDNGSDGSAQGIHINSVFCDGFKNFGTFLSNDSIFPRIDNMHCGAIGSIGQSYSDSGTSHAATITARVDVDGAYDQYSVLTVTSVPSQIDTDLNVLGSMVMFDGDPLPYRIKIVDAVNNQIRVYPRLDKNKTYSQLSYLYGIGLGWNGNNSGAGNFGHLQFILCGIGFWGGSLYGANIDYLSSEYCGVGFTMGKENEVVIAYNVNNSYFETNLFDYVQQWLNNYTPLLNINMAHALNIDKCAEIFSYRVSAWNDERPQNAFNMSSITLGHRKYEIKDIYFTSVDLSDPCDFINVMNTGGDLLLNYSNRAINDKFQMRAKTLVIAQNYVPWVAPTAVTIRVPNGWYLNGVLNGTLTTNPQKFATVLTVVHDATERYNNQSLYVYGESLYKTSGTTAERPANAPTGFVYIDTTLAAAGKPIYKASSGWVDSTGVVV